MGKEKEPVSEQKKANPQQGQSVPAPQGPKGQPLGKVGCLAQGCKGKEARFNFCDEHFRQFKFGLITKMGEPVLDYEKKFEHYERWKAAQKVA
jgi:hypothetical protein